MAKISVIIPVYNTGKYISKCLDSVLNQTFKDFEIICINDASEDDSLSIIQKYAKSNEQIKYKNFEEHKGVSAARNCGIDMSSGEYIFFLDSDDWIENESLEVLLKTIESTGAQIVMNRNLLSFIDGKCYPYHFQLGQLKIPDNSWIDVKKDTHNVFCAIFTKLFRSSLIKKHNIRFPEGYIYEDIFFHYVTFAYAEKIYFFKGLPHYYRKTENSITSNIKSDGDKIINVLGLVYDFYKQHNWLDRGIKIYYTMPIFNINDEKTYTAFKNYFSKAGEYILKNDIYNDMDKFFCKNILDTKDYQDYISQYASNAAISYIRRKK